MSMHKIELTEVERIGLINHGLAVGTPSQLSDCFRLGMKWALETKWVSVDSPEDLPIGEEVLCWDGCEFYLDYADIDGDTGIHFMANGSDVEAYQLLSEPKGNK